MLTKSLQILSKMGQLGLQHGSQEVTAKRGWHLLGPNIFRFRVFVIVLWPSWDHFLIDFWKVLEVENDANNDLNKNVRIVFSPQRESKNEGSEASQKPPTIDEETSS